jgi:hypothetical protein
VRTNAFFLIRTDGGRTNIAVYRGSALPKNETGFKNNKNKKERDLKDVKFSVFKNHQETNEAKRDSTSEILTLIYLNTNTKKIRRINNDSETTKVDAQEYKENL